MSRKKTSDGAQPDGFGDLIYDAARSLGWLIECSPIEVPLSDEELEDVRLPVSLDDPFSGIDTRRTRHRAPAVLPPAPSEELEEGFARAAREGQEKISTEVEDRMRRDRDAVEEEIDGNEP